MDLSGGASCRDRREQERRTTVLGGAGSWKQMMPKMVNNPFNRSTFKKMMGPTGVYEPLLGGEHGSLLDIVYAIIFCYFCIRKSPMFIEGRLSLFGQSARMDYAGPEGYAISSFLWQGVGVASVLTAVYNLLHNPAGLVFSG